MSEYQEPSRVDVSAPANEHVTAPAPIAQRSAQPSAPVVVQKKLSVGAADDPYEREADLVARAVMQSIAQTSVGGHEEQVGPDTRVQPMSGGASHRTAMAAASGPRIRRRAGAVSLSGVVSTASRVQRSAQPAPIGLEGGEVDDDTARTIQRARGGGSPIEPKVRRRLEGGFGADFSGVRIHADSQSDELNRSMSAKAFTTGSDIFFSKGAYQPGSTGGQELLAHELTHTIQQGGAGVSRRVADDGALAHDVTTDAPGRVRRLMNFTSTDLDGTVSGKAKFAKLVGTESTFSKLKGALAAYEKADGWGEQLALLQELKQLGDAWMAKHGTGSDQEKIDSITALLAAVNTEIPVAQKAIQDDIDEQDAYATAMKAGTASFLSGSGKRVAKKAENWHAGEDMLTPQDSAANKLIAKYGLTVAEAMAIGIYTADDYKYINPALADNDGWMTAMLPRLGFNNHAMAKQIYDGVTATHITDAKAQGMLHAKIAVAGMKKLPDYKGTTFRGIGLTPAEFAQQYPVNGTATFLPFSSTSLNEATSRGFAGLESKGDKTGVLLRLSCTKGKDIAAVSNSPGEREILLMPSATFKVKKIRDGDHKGKPIKIVDLTQTN